MKEREEFFDEYDGEDSDAHERTSERVDEAGDGGENESKAYLWEGENDPVKIYLWEWRSRRACLKSLDSSESSSACTWKPAVRTIGHTFMRTTRTT